MSTQAWKKEQYRRRRSLLISSLGGRCCICGATEKIELDHPFGRDWVANRANLLTRIILYEQDHAVGNLRLLCSDCNKHFPPKTPF